MPKIPQRYSWLSWLQQIAGGFVLLCVGGCGAAGFVVTGQLIDGDTGKPMPNAWVHQEWMLSERISLPIEKGGAGTFPCVDEQVVRTDAKGNFRFEQPPKLRYNPITRSASAYVTPLIPGYDIDRDKSKNQGESHQVVVAKKFAEPITREGYMLGMTWFLSGGGRCYGLDKPRTMLNTEISDEAARDFVKNNVTVEEFGEAIRKSLSKDWGYRVSDQQVNEYYPYIAYRNYLERQKAPK